MKIILVANTAWSLYNFRRSLIEKLMDLGHEVVAVAPADDYVQKIRLLGVRFISIPMDNKGTHPARDAALCVRLRSLFRAENPGLVILFTIKPVIFGSIAARLCRIPVISVVTGLGSAFLRNDHITKIVENLYRFSQKRVRKVFVLNEDDLRFFRERRIAPADKLECLNGEGIDLKSYDDFADLKDHSKRKFRFLLAGRMLWDKGVGEFVDAARRLRPRFPAAEFCLLGFMDAQNPTAISHEIMTEWVREGVIRYLGQTNDIKPELAMADCVVLPSYREGISRFLLEAGAMGLPIVATDVTGCREIVEHGVNGYLCRPRDSGDLAEQLERILLLSKEALLEMGLRGRSKVEKEFDEALVIAKYLQVIRKILSEPVSAVSV